MARRSVSTQIRLDHLYCHDEADGPGAGEPYLWVVYFKVDGETVVLDRVSEDPVRYRLTGTCTFFTTPGSHGNLNDSSVEAGDTVPIPAVLGEFDTVLTPIPLSPAAKAGLPFLDDAPAFVGVGVVLMEQNWSDNGPID